MFLNYTQTIAFEEFSKASKMAQIAAKIAYYNFEWRYVTVVLYNTMHLLGISTFCYHYKQSVVLKMGRFIPIRRVPVPQFVLFGEETTELTSMLRWLARSQYDTTGKFVIICVSFEDTKCDENVIFSTLAKAYITNVIYVRSSSDSKEPIVWSYNLVLPEKCNNSEPVPLNMSLGCINDSCFKHAFPEKFYNLYKCPFIVSTFEQPPFMYLKGNKISGEDGEILNLVANILNASLTIITPAEGADWGHYEKNNWTGSLGDVYNDRAHASMCSAPLTSAKYGNFQISITYNSMDMVWASRLPALKPPWEKLLYPLQEYVRLIIFLMFIGIIFMNTLTKTRAWRKVITALKIGQPKSNLLFYSWIIFMGMPVTRVPSKPAILLILCLWLWFCFIIRTVYQASLMTFMKHRIYDANFEKFNDVLSNKYPFGGLLSLREYYWEEKEIYDNWIGVDLVDANSLLNSMSNGSSNFVIALNKDTIMDQLLKYGKSNHLQIIPEKIVNSPTVIFFKKHSFFAAPVSRILSMSMEGGFNQRMYTRFISKGRFLFRHSNTQRTEALHLEHFAGCIAVLNVGWILSIIFFAVEVICGKLAKRTAIPFNH